MPPDPTVWELARQLEHLRLDVRDDINALGARLDAKVGADLLKLEQSAQDAAVRVLADRVKELEDARTADMTRAIATRRWLIAAVLVPLVAILLPLLLPYGSR
ncbi:hypothetical protein ACIBSV_12045 [Embleya sp. NPDC050154]|uniref:hypothetical protein n=1 Tax=Embleya sp. NPDC050154 TaxID=3363988 RepID=UPI0037B37998